jgi:hypothetical protein
VPSTLEQFGCDSLGHAADTEGRGCPGDQAAWGVSTRLLQHGQIGHGEWNEHLVRP